MSSPPMHEVRFGPNSLPHPESPLYIFPSRSWQEPFSSLNGNFVTMPASIYLSIHAATIMALYLLLYVKISSSRAKQFLALPIILWLLAMPIFCTASSHLIHLICAFITPCYGMRFIDIYYLKPWTGMRSYYNGQYSLHLARRQPCTEGSSESEEVAPIGENSHEIVRRRSVSDGAGQPRSNNLRNGLPYDGMELDEWLMWDSERLRTELWASVRKLPNVRHGASDRKGVSMGAILPRALVYIFVGDAILLSITDTRITDVDQLSPLTRQIVLATVGGATIAFMMLNFFYLILFGWAILMRQNVIYPSEWTMTTHRFPLFATDPADFWSQWHTLFKFVWVDFAYFPLRRFVQRFMGPSRTGSKTLSKALELALPVLGVFVLSGVSHSYCIWATWREPPASQMNYFLLQGFAVVITKGFQQTLPGRRWCRFYHSQSERQRKWIDRLGMTAMVVFHVLTAPPFIEPYARREVWLGHRARSVLWHFFVKHWT